MRSAIRGATAALLVLTVAGAWRPLGQPLSIGAESTLQFDGKSTVRDWSCKATAIEGVIDASGTDVVAGVLAGQKAVKGATLTFPAAKLDCDNGTMNKHMLNALNASKHAAITFALTDYDLTAAAPVTGTLRGVLTINGIAKPVTIPSTFEAAPSGALRVTGTYVLNMTDWDVEPPKLMLGTLKVRDSVTVAFNLLLQH
ncbi:MAG: YceI family protein [Gemmatimonadales bacterium]|nr:YceI family protein [Gemmatimonadota bacterium]MCL4212446.1 YceI family protein [Gemmatimonadales bacterium]